MEARDFLFKLLPLSAAKQHKNHYSPTEYRCPSHPSPRAWGLDVLARRTVPENADDESAEQRTESNTTRNAVALAASSRKRIVLALRTLQELIAAMTWWCTSRTEQGLLPGRVPLCYFLWVLRRDRGHVMDIPGFADISKLCGTPLCVLIDQLLSSSKRFPSPLHAVGEHAACTPR